MSKHVKSLAEHLARPSLIDSANLRTVSEAALRPLSDAILSPDNTLRFALHVAANVIASGELDRFRPRGPMSATAVGAPHP